MRTRRQQKEEEESKAPAAQKRGRGRAAKSPPPPAKKTKVSPEPPKARSKSAATMAGKAKPVPKATKKPKKPPKKKPKPKKGQVLTRPRSAAPVATKAAPAPPTRTGRATRANARRPSPTPSPPPKKAPAKKPTKTAPPPKKVDTKKNAPPAKQAKPKVKNDPPQKAAKTDDTNIVKVIKKGAAPVDQFCPRAKDCHVFQDNTKVWAATLNQTNLNANNNKFYIIQVLKSDTGNEFYCWNRWGRVGYAGQSSMKGPFTHQIVAIQQFQSKYNTKTRGGYTEIEINYEADDDEPKPEKKTSAKAKKPTKQKDSKLDQRVQDLIRLICNMDMINKTLSEIGYDAKKMPLGKLGEGTIKQGLNTLKKISTALKSGDRDKLANFSSLFYTHIPHDFGFTKMRDHIIDTAKKVKDKIEMLESLSDIKLATKMLKAAADDDSNEVDRQYNNLNCDMRPIDKSDKKYKMICDYITNTHGSTHTAYSLDVLDIFEISREPDESRFKTNIKNRMLLWHGSRLSNYCGILSQGLRIAPPEAPVTGYMFGKGIYFADMVSKSANYCFTNPSANTGLMMLCEVALGDMWEKLQADCHAGENLPKGKLSTKGIGRNAPPANSYTVLDKATVPIGKAEPTNVANGSLIYNEYIVYNVNQARIKYLIKLKFNYTNSRWF